MLRDGIRRSRFAIRARLFRHSGRDAACRVSVCAISALSVQRPFRMLGDNRIRILRQRSQRRHKFLIAAIAHGNHGIPPQSRKLGAAHGRPTKRRSKFLGLHFRQPFKPGIHQLCTRLEFIRRRNWRLAIPGANVLADVAAKDMTPHASA